MVNSNFDITHSHTTSKKEFFEKDFTTDIA